MGYAGGFQTELSPFFKDVGFAPHLSTAVAQQRLIVRVLEFAFVSSLNTCFRLYRKDKRGLLELCENADLDPDRIIDLRLITCVEEDEKKDKPCITLKLSKKAAKTGDMVW
jgi:hypothetical protein